MGTEKKSLLKPWVQVDALCYLFHGLLVAAEVGQGNSQPIVQILLRVGVLKVK